MFLYVCKQTFCKSKVRMSQKVKGVIMRNLRDTVFYMKTNVLQYFHICIRVPLSFDVSHLKQHRAVYLNTLKALTSLQSKQIHIRPIFNWFRSNRWQMFFKIGVFTGKHPCLSLFLISIAGLQIFNFLKRASNTGAFLRNLQNF